ncbi:hypothetical protein ACWHA3_36220 [Streptomyces cyaneofuscatus]
MCVDVLCAYLRMPYETDPAGPGFRHGEREVRLTIIRTIRSHLQDPSASPPENVERLKSILPPVKVERPYGRCVLP